MFTFQQDTNSAIGRYRDMVRSGERRALRIAEDEPRPAVGGRLYQVAHWLNAQWVNRGHTLIHSGVAPMHSEQPVG